MGYTTVFCGCLKTDKPVTDSFRNFINIFNRTRRMKRDVEKIKEINKNWKNYCFNGNLGEDGAFYVGGEGDFGQDKDDSIIDYNRAPSGQPGLWCQWYMPDNVTVEWDGGEKFYEYTKWLSYLIKNFFIPAGYILNGEISWFGEDEDDRGKIEVIDNKIFIRYVEITYGEPKEVC